MMCYRDRTWCSFTECKKASKCDRAFTESDRQKAKEWWGGDDYPVCFFSEKPDCYEEPK